MSLTTSASHLPERVTRTAISPPNLHSCAAQTPPTPPSVRADPFSRPPLALRAPRRVMESAPGVASSARHSPSSSTPEPCRRNIEIFDLKPLPFPFNAPPPLPQTHWHLNGRPMGVSQRGVSPPARSFTSTFLEPRADRPTRENPCPESEESAVTRSCAFSFPAFVARISVGGKFPEGTGRGASCYVRTAISLGSIWVF